MKLLKAVLWTAPLKDAEVHITRQVDWRVYRQVDWRVYRQVDIRVYWQFYLQVLDQVALPFTVEK